MRDRPDPLDEAPDGLALGAINGGGPVPVADALRAVAQRVQTARLAHSSEFGLNVVFQIPGTFLKPTFEGVRLGMVFTKRRAMIAQVAVPESIEPASVATFVLDSVETAIDLAEERVTKRGLGWSSSGLRATLDDVRSEPRQP